MEREQLDKIEKDTSLRLAMHRQKLADCVAEFLRTIRTEPLDAENLNRLENIGRDALSPINRLPDGRWVSKPTGGHNGS